MKQATLLFLLRDDQILLAMKKRGFGANRWNGVGGKPNPGEAIIEAAVRECQEEISVTPHNLREAATLTFYNQGNQDSDMQVITFVSRTWDGQPSESEEMAPKWFAVEHIPYSRMWPDDKHWLPKVLVGQSVTGDFWFDAHDNLVKFTLKP